MPHGVLCKFRNEQQEYSAVGEKQFKLLCKAIGVHPPLELSHSLVQFSATALNDVSTATLFVINNHVSLNQFSHAVPRIGKGDIAPVGPTSFQFIIPEGSPITIMPCVGTILPGKKCLVEVSFRPVLGEQLIKQEAVEMMRRAAEMRVLRARELEFQFFEMLEIRSEKATLSITLIGEGVIPSILCSVEGDVLNLGYVIAKETATSTFKIENTSSIDLKFSILLESLSPNRDKQQQKPPAFLTSQGQMDFVGTQNYSGLSVFSVTPVEGIVGTGKSQEFTVTFSPDHESLYYSDCLKIMLFAKEIIRTIQLKGCARNHMMFVEGGDPLDVPIESLAMTTSPVEAESDKLTKPILLKLECVQSETLVVPAVRELRVGGIRTAQFASKKIIEFNWESLSVVQMKGFTIDPVKGTVDRGQTKVITVSWMPPAGSDPTQLMTGTATLILKGDVKEVYSVYFISRIVIK
uniref:Uncharacterized protein n=1 Tax=Sphaerodactylus townsendi TaxID=933632 RepID=A0ACB8EEC9_9SAUR